MKLLIAIPTLDYIHTEFVKSLLALQRQIRCDYEVCIISGTLVYRARDALAKKAIEEDFTHVLWLDSDMVFQETLLEDLMWPEKEFVSGVYQARRKGYDSCMFDVLDWIDGELKTVSHVQDYPADTFEIAGCGFGCVLMETKILKNVLERYGTCFTPLHNVGEDVAFCVRAREIGYKIYCEPSAVCGHIGHITIYPEDHTDYLKKLEMQ